MVTKIQTELPSQQMALQEEERLLKWQECSTDVVYSPVSGTD